MKELFEDEINNLSSDTNREWEERFDEKFGTFTLGSGKGHTIATEHNIKSFLQEELIREREKWFWKGYQRGVDVQMPKESLTEEEIKDVLEDITWSKL